MLNDKQQYKLANKRLKEVILDITRFSNYSEDETSNAIFNFNVKNNFIVKIKGNKQDILRSYPYFMALEYELSSSDYWYDFNIKYKKINKFRILPVSIYCKKGKFIMEINNSVRIVVNNDYKYEFYNLDRQSHITVNGVNIESKIDTFMFKCDGEIKRIAFEFLSLADIDLDSKTDEYIDFIYKTSFFHGNEYNYGIPTLIRPIY